MADFIVTNEASTGVIHSGHKTERVLKGTLPAVRTALIEALEKLGYHVLSEQPLVARRRASLDSLAKLQRSVVTVTITLKTASERVTTVVVDYEVANTGMYEGDHATIEREVDALVALARQSIDGEGHCSTCETPHVSDSSFCRGCGSPKGRRQLAELELLRLDGETRFGHRANLGGLTVAILALVVGLPMIFFGTDKVVNAGWVLLLIGEAISLILLIVGTHSVHKALNPAPGSSPHAFETRYRGSISEYNAARATMADEMTARPIHSASQTYPPSVVDGTTELLPSDDHTSRSRPD
ncbi:hypothetical protein [Leptolyngbya sp. 7M]|uniref:hypothetical protein n=1 Tax=Leptolyngbya sp. 7M TaxID=2812896 RepID=UPI001B8DA582|nr:hypothetical protein [Leptolyngbya sp. 7M]QYO65362.1 hypothetical protein JVX88_00840 [Leptolyngbya sp. 7M]